MHVFRLARLSGRKGIPRLDVVIIFFQNTILYHGFVSLVASNQPEDLALFFKFWGGSLFFLFQPIDEQILVVSTSGNDQNDYENENLFKLKEDQFISVFLLCKSPKLHILGVIVAFCYEMKRYPVGL